MLVGAAVGGGTVGVAVGEVEGRAEGVVDGRAVGGTDGAEVLGAAEGKPQCSWRRRSGEAWVQDGEADGAAEVVGAEVEGAEVAGAEVGAGVVGAMEGNHVPPSVQLTRVTPALKKDSSQPQRRKADSPMVVTPSGMTTEVRAAHE